MPPRHIADVALFKEPSERPHPGWISFGVDGKYAYPDGGAVIDTATKKVVARIPTSEKLIEIAAAYHLYARHWVATFFAFAASLVAHLATFTTFLFVAYALHAEDVRKQPPVPVPAVDFFAVMPIERTITAVPISLAGIGLREKLLQVMLNNLCGVTIEKSKLIGSLGFLVIVICCAPGGIVYFFYKPSGVAKRVRISEMQREVATAEHEIPEPQ